MVVFVVIVQSILNDRPAADIDGNGYLSNFIVRRMQAQCDLRNVKSLLLRCCTLKLNCLPFQSDKTRTTHSLIRMARDGRLLRQKRNMLVRHVRVFKNVMNKSSNNTYEATHFTISTSISIAFSHRQNIFCVSISFQSYLSCVSKKSEIDKEIQREKQIDSMDMHQSRKRVAQADRFTLNTGQIACVWFCKQ